MARSGVWVGLALLAPVVLLGPGCLPQEKLSSYSRAWTDGPAATPDAAGGASTGSDASAGNGGLLGGNGGSSSEASSGAGELADAGEANDGQLDASTEPSSIDAGSTPSDAGGVPLTVPLTDAGVAPAAP